MTTEAATRSPSAHPRERRPRSEALLEPACARGRGRRGRADRRRAARRRQAARCSATAAARPTRRTSPPSSSAASCSSAARCRRSRCPTTRRRSPRSATTTATSASSPARSRRSARPGDVALGISTSGRSAERARRASRRRARRGLATIGLTGADGGRCADARRRLHRGAVRRHAADPGGATRSSPTSCASWSSATSPERGLPRPRRGHQPQGARGRVRHVVGRVRVPAGRARRARGCSPALGLPVVVATNQRGIARGRMHRGGPRATSTTRMRAEVAARGRPHRRDLPLPARRGGVRLPQAAAPACSSARRASSGSTWRAPR